MLVTFAQLIAQGADAAQIAEKSVCAWRAVESALSPIIGQRAVAALYKRSVALVHADYPWLMSHETGSLRSRQSDEFDLLRTILSQQTSSDAMAAHWALLRTFRNLLANLIGESLTERLLGSVCEFPSSAGVAQEPSS
jgi:hypothetical protein